MQILDLNTHYLIVNSLDSLIANRTEKGKG